MSLSGLQQTGYNEATEETIMVDSGAIYYVTNDKTAINLVEADFNLLGATQGGASFTINESWRNIQIDGVKGNPKGARVRESVNPQLTVNNLEFKVENLTKLIAGATTEDYPDSSSKTHDLISRVAEVDLGDYIRWVLLVGRLSVEASVGSTTEPIIFGIENVLQDGGFNFDAADGGEAVPTATFSGHYDPTALSQEPWRIWVPAGTGLPVLTTSSEMVAGMSDPDLTINLLHDTYDDTGAVDTANWTLNDPDTTGLSLGTISKTDDDTIIMSLTGTDITAGTIELVPTADVVSGDTAPESLSVEVQA